MIDCWTKLDASRCQRIRAFLHDPGAPAGVCGEHDPSWLQILEKSFGHRGYVIVEEDHASQSLRGYLPLALVKSMLFGKFLVSLPYLNRAGVLGSEEETRRRLIDRACELADELDVTYLELRHGQPVEHPKLTVQRDEKKRMVLDLPGSPEALWKSLDAKVRNQIRKGEKSGLTVRFGTVELLHDFYDVFAVNMRDLGTPVYSSTLFAKVVTKFGKDGSEASAGAELVVVYWEGKPVAGAMLVHDRAYVHQPASTQVPSASSLRSASATSANMWMYHQLLLRAMGRGSLQFDFGRSTMDSGTYKFKKQWGAKPCDTVWQYYVRKGDVCQVRPDNPKYRRRIEMWQRLPVWLTRVIGPTIVRGIP